MMQELADAGLRLEVDGLRATVTLCRPQTRNAQSPVTWAALREIGRSLPTSVRVVVVRAEGESFSAGLDRRMLSTGADPDPHAAPDPNSLLALSRLDDPVMNGVIAGYQEAFSWLRRPELVTIAAVQGHAVGAGFQLALACDLTVLAQDAKLAMREASLGLVPDLGGTQPLVEAVGYSRALEICLTGRLVDAAEARHLGLATLVVPRSDLDEAVDDLVAAVSGPPAQVVAATKALLQSVPIGSLADQLAAERSAQVSAIRGLHPPRSGNKPTLHGVAPPDE